MKNQNREDRVVEAAENSRSNGLITLSTGVVLRPKRVSNMLFADLVRRFDRPKPPTWNNPDTGRLEENYDHPVYKEAVEAYNADVSLAIVELMVLMGTELVSVPKGFDGPDGDWADELKIVMGDKLGEPGSKKRYLYWAKYIAAADQDDINRILEGVGRLSGVSEQDVSEAIGRFRDSS